MSDAGIFRPRGFAAFVLFSAGLSLLAFSIDDGTKRNVATPPRYMPVTGGEPDDLDRLETEWNNRLTYPTGLFDPAWVRLAAAADARITRAVPFGAQRLQLNAKGRS